MNQRQKQQTAIAVAILLVVLALFLLIRGGTQSVSTSGPAEWERIANLERIEIEPPAGGEGPDLIVMERRDGEWWLLRPVQARVDPAVADSFDARFGRRMVADKAVVDPDRFASYELDEESGVGVRLFAEGQDRPAREFVVGRQTEVVQTGAMRTFVREPGDDQVYRMHGSIGDLVRLSEVELRQRQIPYFGPGKIEAIRIEHADGHEVVIEEVDGRWRLGGERAEQAEVDERRARRLVSTLASLAAMDFPREMPEELGLDEPTTVVEVSSAGSTASVEVRRIDDEERVRYVMRRSGGSAVYELYPESGRLLTSRQDDIQSRALIPVASPWITEMRLAGQPEVHLRRDDADSPWEMLSPEGWKADFRRAQRLAEFVAGIRVHSWEEGAGIRPDVLPGWVVDTLPSVTIVVEGKETKLYLAAEVPGRRGERYAYYSERDGGFVLSREAVQRLTGGPDSVGIELE